MTKKKTQKTHDNSKKFCGAKNRKGGTCKRPAGWGTDHVGEGKCKLHGGATPIKHGLYSKYITRMISPKNLSIIDELSDETELNELKAEIIRLRVILIELSERQIELRKTLAAGKVTGESGEDVQELIANMSADDYYPMILKVIQRIADTVEKRNRIKYGQKLNISFSEDQLRRFLAKVRDVIRDELSGAKIKDYENIIRRIFRRIGIKDV